MAESPNDGFGVPFAIRDFLDNPNSVGFRYLYLISR
jgi:hypothetical protein